MKANQKSASLVNCGGIAFRLLTDTDRERIHLATLEVLSHTGVHFASVEAREILAKAGAMVNAESGVVKIPAFMVEEALRTAPSTFVLHGKTQEFDVEMGGYQVNYCNYPSSPFAEDLDTGEVRLAKKQDLANVARIMDYLDEYSFCFSSMIPQDVDQRSNNLHNFEAHFTNMRKPIIASSRFRRSVEYDVEMAASERGSHQKLREEPTIMFACCSISPLCVPDDACDVLITSAEQDMPVSNVPMALCGGMAPITMAGALVVANAENLSCLVLQQVVRKGAKFAYGGSPGIMDMRHNAMAVTGTPESAMMVAAHAEMAHFYNLPSFLGSTADSNCSDYQAGHEKTLICLLSALSGVNMTYVAGMLSSGMAQSLGQLVLDADVIKMCYQALDGVLLNENSLALDLINSVGPRGDFLGEMHTFQQFRQLQSVPYLFNRDTRDKWTKDGCPEIKAQANMKAREILETHHPEVVTDTVREKIHELVLQGEKELCQEA